MKAAQNQSSVNVSPLRAGIWACDVCGRVATVTLAGMHRCDDHAPGGAHRWHPVVPPRRHTGSGG